MPTRHVAVPAVYAIFLRDFSNDTRWKPFGEGWRAQSDVRVLLMLRQNTGYQDGNWGLPSGHVEAGELPKEALVREVKEELGVTIGMRDLISRHTSYRTAHDNTGDRVDFFFSIGVWLGEITNTEPYKCARLEWFPLGELPQNVMPHVREALESGWAHHRYDHNSYSEMGVDWLKKNGVYQLSR
jgi:8-oxo-dGTP diphosphatase